MITRTNLNNYLRDFLNITQIKDYCPNGLQVEGCVEINRIVSGVTASQALIDAAIDCKADALLVHHGYFWKGEEPTINHIKKQRIQRLLQHDMNLFAYHLPLDVHSQLGNNVELAKQLGLSVEQSVAAGGIEDLVWIGKLKQPQTSREFAAHIAQQLNREPFSVIDDSHTIETIAWCTGGAQNYIDVALQYQCDAYLTGEVSEQTVHFARETGIQFFAAGHHATERYGIKALGEHLAENFSIEHQFIDIDNPV